MFSKTSLPDITSFAYITKSYGFMGIKLYYFYAVYEFFLSDSKKKFLEFYSCMKGLFMNIQNNPNVNFKANISDTVLCQLKQQAETSRSRKFQKLALQSKLKEVDKWGDSNLTIVRTKDIYGFYRLGIEYFVTPLLKYSWAIKGLKGKTELSQFLALKEAHIINTVESIKYLYSKYGPSFFNRYK